MANTVPMRPTKKDKPSEGKPPVFWNSVKTSWADAFLGAIYMSPRISIQAQSRVEMRKTYVDKGDQDGKEPQNVYHQHESLNHRQGFPQDGVDQHSNQNACPEQKRSLPLLRHIIGIIQLDQCLDLSSTDVAATGQNGHPAADDEPACGPL